MFFLFCLVSIFSSAQANERVVYGNDFEIINHSYEEDSQSVSMGSNTVILEEDRIEANIQMSSGPSCLFEGVKLEGDIYGPSDEQKVYGESCRVILEFKATEFGKVLNLSSHGNCVSFCGAGAELKASGLQKF